MAQTSTISHKCCCRILWIKIYLKKKHAYQYDKCSGVFPKSIKKIASASYFNQDDAGNNADEAITKYENSIGSYFNRFSNETINDFIDNVFCAKLVTHLILRTSHFREVFLKKYLKV